MKASDVNGMTMIRNALSGIPASMAENLNDISFEGEGRTRYDCGIPSDPYATSLDEGGKHALIGDINRIMQLAGTGLYLRQRGASNEFDERVVEIDRGSKGPEGNWGYPNGAIIDWWDGTTFQKVICVKSGVGEENGNCIYGPDDQEHGVNGTGEKYWSLVEKPKQTQYLGEEACAITDVSTFQQGAYNINRFARIELIWNVMFSSQNVAVQNAIPFYMWFVLRRGDVMSLNAGSSVTINEKTFAPTSSSIYTNATVKGGGVAIGRVFRIKWGT